MSSRRYFVALGERELVVDVERLRDGKFRVRVEGEATPRELTLLREGPNAALLAEGRVIEAFGAGTRELTVGSERRRIAVSERSSTTTRSGSAGAGEAVIRAPMPGRVLKLLVLPGQAIAAGAAVAVVEAMKMENELLAPRAGVVKRVPVRAGDTVERDAVLVELE